VWRKGVEKVSVTVFGNKAGKGVEKRCQSPFFGKSLPFKKVSITVLQAEKFSD